MENVINLNRDLDQKTNENADLNLKVDKQSMEIQNAKTEIDNVKEENAIKEQNEAKLEEALGEVQGALEIMTQQCETLKVKYDDVKIQSKQNDKETDGLQETIKVLQKQLT